MRSRGEDGWNLVTWADYERDVRRVAAGLAEFGIGRGDRVGILSANRAEWHLADLGSLANGSVSVPIYLTSSPSQIAYILRHSEARVCFVDSHEQLGKVLEVRGDLPRLERLVLFGASRRAQDSDVTSFGELLGRGDECLARDPQWFDDRAGQLAPGDLATIVYTSGTTGLPKGALITHANIVWTLNSAVPPFALRQGERLLSFLPLSHIAERMMSLFLPIAVCGETWFARGLATVAEDLPACRPTLFLAVPRVWEKLREGIEERLRSLPLPLRTAAHRYVSLGLRKVDAEQAGTGLSLVARAEYLALDRTLGAVLREQLGLDRAHVLISAAAPVHASLIRWFHAIGLPVLQIYGQTEACGPTTANLPEHNCIGTVGTPLPGVSVRLADDGEILVKGGNVCQGYFKDQRGTTKLFDAEGWMHSGDTGTIDPDGCLRIVGRKKELIITAGGHNVAPQGIENDLRNHPLISQAVVIGEGRRYLTALVTLDPEALSRWASERGKLVELEALAADPDLQSEVQEAINAVNSRWSHAEAIRKFRVLAHDFTVSAGELTPTLKVKRDVVCERYASLIDELYATG
jgi:long-chain acyl-CoA synthetase